MFSQMEINSVMESKTKEVGQKMSSYKKVCSDHLYLALWKRVYSKYVCRPRGNRLRYVLRKQITQFFFIHKTPYLHWKSVMKYPSMFCFISIRVSNTLEARAGVATKEKERKMNVWTGRTVRGRQRTNLRRTLPNLETSCPAPARSGKFYNWIFNSQILSITVRVYLPAAVVMWCRSFSTNSTGCN